jgi:hypothetical protein
MQVIPLLVENTNIGEIPIVGGKHQQWHRGKHQQWHNERLRAIGAKIERIN